MTYNDPFDCLICNDDSEIERCFKLVVDYYMFKAVSELIMRKDLKLRFGEKILFAWVKTELKFMKFLLKKQPYYDGIPIFDKIMNYVLDNKILFNDETKKEFMIKRNDFVEQMKKLVYDIKDSLLVSCFSETCDSILMWSHYADSHKGVCIEFENEDNDFF